MKGRSGIQKKMEVPPILREDPNKLKFIRVTVADFKKYEAEIKGLRYNALDTNQGRELSAYEKDVKELDQKYLEVAQQGELCMAIKQGVVVAFVALKKKTEGSTMQKAVIDKVRYAAGLSRLSKATAIIKELLVYAQSQLHNEGVYRKEIEAVGDHHNLSGFQGASRFKNFEIKESAEEIADTMPGPKH